MKSFKMKVLAVAVLGLAGLGMAGSAFACPTAVQTAGTTIPGGGGAWTSQFIGPGATFNITSPGLNSTGCALYLSLGAASNSAANVKDSSPQATAPFLTGEGRYRARFYLSLANLPAATFNVSNQTVTLFRANSATGPAQFTSDQLVVKIAGGATPTVRFFVSDLNPVSGVTQVPAVPLPASATNTYRIEFDMQVGTGATTVNGCSAAMPATGGCVRYWVTDAAAASTDAAPTGSVTVNNGTVAAVNPGWGGVKTAFLGMQTGSPQYRASHAGIVLVFDEFDSRRQTFIGQ